MSDTWSMRLPVVFGQRLSLDIPRLTLSQAVLQPIQLQFQPDAPDQIQAPQVPHGEAEGHRPALGIELPLENIGGVVCLRPMRSVPFVVTGSTLPAPVVERGMSWPSGLGAGISLRFDDFGNFGIFGSLMNAPIVGDFSLGYAPPRERR